MNKTQGKKLVRQGLPNLKLRKVKKENGSIKK
jgi:hypothetical protein